MQPHSCKARLKVLLKVLIRLLKARLKVLLKVLIRRLQARLKVLLKVYQALPRGEGKGRAYKDLMRTFKAYLSEP